MEESLALLLRDFFESFRPRDVAGNEHEPRPQPGTPAERRGVALSARLIEGHLHRNGAADLKVDDLVAGDRLLRKFNTSSGPFYTLAGGDEEIAQLPTPKAAPRSPTPKAAPRSPSPPSSATKDLAAHVPPSEETQLEKENADLQHELSTATKTEKADWKKTYAEYIDLLHQYNELKDGVQELLGRLAVLRQTTTRSLYGDFGLAFED